MDAACRIVAAGLGLAVLPREVAVPHAGAGRLALVPLATLLSVAPVSRRFRRLADDSQLWKRLYYARFVLPRALRLPGFRTAAGPGGPLPPPSAAPRGQRASRVKAVIEIEP